MLRRRGGVLGTEPTRGGTGAIPAVAPGVEVTAGTLLRAEGEEGEVVVAA